MHARPRRLEFVRRHAARPRNPHVLPTERAQAQCQRILVTCSHGGKGKNRCTPGHAASRSSGDTQPDPAIRMCCHQKEHAQSVSASLWNARMAAREEQMHARPRRLEVVRRHAARTRDPHVLPPERAQAQCQRILVECSHGGKGRADARPATPPPGRPATRSPTRDPHVLPPERARAQCQRILVTCSHGGKGRADACVSMQNLPRKLAVARPLPTQPDLAACMCWPTPHSLVSMFITWGA